MALHAGPLLATHGTPGLYLAMLWLDTQPGILVRGERGGHGLACRDTRSMLALMGCGWPGGCSWAESRLATSTLGSHLSICLSAPG